MAQQKQIRLGTMRLRVQSLASLSVLRIWHCRELCCRSQTQLGSGIAVAVVLAAIASNGPLAWEPPNASGAALKKAKEKKFFFKQTLKKNTKKYVEFILTIFYLTQSVQNVIISTFNQYKELLKSFTFFSKFLIMCTHMHACMHACISLAVACSGLMWDHNFQTKE